MDILQALADSAPAVALRRPGPAYPLLNAAHIMSIGLVFGSAVVLDLRLLGVLRTPSVRDLGPLLSQAAAVGVCLALATGLFLFSVRPDAYARNPAFLLKLTLVALGIANAFALRMGRHWRQALDGGDVHLRVKTAAGVSLAIWAAAIIAGRWIAFTA